jgi:N-sulfoglucosamine sulfohydrolase
VLCIVCEDISPLLGSYGDPVARTPVLDRLAREGVRFTRMFSSSGVCAPSRAALITGMYATAIGANNMRTSSADRVGLPPYEAVPPPAVRPFAEYLRAAGYYTTNNAKTDYQFAPPLTAWDESGREAHWRNRPEGMPFFSVFNLETTHESQVWDRAHDPAVVAPEHVVLPPYYPDTPRSGATSPASTATSRSWTARWASCSLSSTRPASPTTRSSSSTPTTGAPSRAASASCSTRASTFPS